jgi:two-component system LytT family response regulator
MAPLRTLIVDDEALARDTLRRLLGQDPEIALVGECAGGAEAADRIRAESPDIVFLDVQMPEVDGFETLRRAGPTSTVVVFTTAYDQYALRAFEAEALDYLLKPFDDARFFRTLDRAKGRVRDRQVHQATRTLIATLGEQTQPSAQPTAPYADRIAVRERGRMVFVAVDDIDWIEAADYCVRIHASGRIHLLREPLRDLEGRLDPRRFIRVHRSALVNLSRIKELQPHFNGESVVLLSDGTRLRLSRGRRQELHRLLGIAG